MARKQTDVAAERAVLSNLLQGGKDAYLDIVDLIQDSTVFNIPENAIIFSCIKYCFDKLELEQLELASIFSAAKSLNIDDFITSPKTQNHLQNLFNFAIKRENLRKFALKVRRLSAIRMMKNELINIQASLDLFTGDEKVSEIIGAIEAPIFDLSNKIGNTEDEIVRIPNTLLEYIEQKLENPVETNGISTGFPLFDQAVGGGMAPGDLHVICASAKNYKTGFVMNCANHMVKNGVKVLILDSELRLEQQQSRLLAMESGIATNDIRTGAFGQTEEDLEKVREAYKCLSDTCLDFVSIAGKPFEECLSILRRWYHKNVGRGDPCIFIYDYLKVPSFTAGSESEYNLLGHMTSALKDFGTNNEISALALCQQNREGGKTLRDDEYTTGDSFKIVQYCSSLSVFRKKTVEEIAEDGTHNGNQLLKPAVARDGAGSDFGYINYQVDGSCMQIKELGLRSQQVGELELPVDLPEDDSLTIEFE